MAENSGSSPTSSNHLTSHTTPDPSPSTLQNTHTSTHTQNSGTTPQTNSHTTSPESEINSETNVKSMESEITVNGGMEVDKVEQNHDGLRNGFVNGRREIPPDSTPLSEILKDVLSYAVRAFQDVLDSFDFLFFF